MNTTQALGLFMDPLMVWSRLAWKTGEVAIASAQVIGHRVSRLALASAIPSTRDQREFSLMGGEKAEAALESAQAVWMRMLGMNQQFAALAMKQILSTSVTLMSLAASRTPAESVARQAKIVRETMTNSAVAASTLSGAAARVARSAARPVHTRISGNARRLSRRSR
jgi:hypothetical protein